MTSLRQRMIEDMQIRRSSLRRYSTGVLYCGQCHAVFDRPLRFPCPWTSLVSVVSKGLGLSRPQIRNSQIETQTNVSLPATVDSMTTRTLAQKVFAALHQR